MKIDTSLTRLRTSPSPLHFSRTYNPLVLVFTVPPRWILEPSDKAFAQGSDAKIECKADGFPKPQVTWKKAPGKFCWGSNSTTHGTARKRGATPEYWNTLHWNLEMRYCGDWCYYYNFSLYLILVTMGCFFFF